MDTPHPQPQTRGLGHLPIVLPCFLPSPVAPALAAASCTRTPSAASSVPPPGPPPLGGLFDPEPPLFLGSPAPSGVPALSLACEALWSPRPPRESLPQPWFLIHLDAPWPDCRHLPSSPMPTPPPLLVLFHAFLLVPAELSPSHSLSGFLTPAS